MDTHWYISFKWLPKLLVSKPFMSNNHRHRSRVSWPPRPSHHLGAWCWIQCSALSPVCRQSGPRAEFLPGDMNKQQQPFRKINQPVFWSVWIYVFFKEKLYNYCTLKLKESKILLWYFLIFNHPIYLISNYLETSTGSLASQLPWNCRLAELFNGILRLAVFRWIFLDLLVS